MKTFWQRFFGNPRVIAGLTWFALVVVVAVLAPLLAPTDPFAMVDKPFLKPFGDYVFGTDSLGRSMWAGLAHGA